MQYCYCLSFGALFKVADKKFVKSGTDINSSNWTNFNYAFGFEEKINLIVFPIQFNPPNLSLIKWQAKIEQVWLQSLLRISLEN